MQYIGFRKKVKVFKRLKVKQTPLPFYFGLSFLRDRPACGGSIQSPNLSHHVLKRKRTFCTIKIKRFITLFLSCYRLSNNF